MNELVVCGTKLKHSSRAAEFDSNVPASRYFRFLEVAASVPNRLEAGTFELAGYEFGRPLKALLPCSAPLALRSQVSENPLGVASLDGAKADFEIDRDGLSARILGIRGRHKQRPAEEHG
jgi:hypothetical protein